MPDYVVEPPDLILVEVLEALPGRPISGERLVRPDGKISLGFYGDVYVAGLTLPEVKEKIVLHLRKYLTDEVLGLVEIDRTTTGARSRQERAGQTQGSQGLRPGLRRRHGLQQQELLRPGRRPRPGQDADHRQRDRARRHQLRRRPDADGRAPEHPAGPPGSPGCLLRADPAGQPGRHHQRRRPDHQLPAHARRPDRRLSRPDRPHHDLPRSDHRTFPDGRGHGLADDLLHQFPPNPQDIRSVGAAGTTGTTTRIPPTLPLEPGAR